MATFQKPTRTRVKLKMALSGPPNSGKSYTAYLLARGVVGDAGRIAVIDTESYAFPKSVPPSADYGYLPIAQFHPANYIESIKDAEREGFDLIIIDSLSHAWFGPGGVLEQVHSSEKNYGNNSYFAWREGTPLQNALILAMLSSPCHIIATLRTRFDIVTEPNAAGKMVPRKVGLKAVQREDAEYEFDFIGEMDQDHRLSVSKARAIFSEAEGKEYLKPGISLGQQLGRWLDDGMTVPGYGRSNTLGEAAAAEIERLAREAGYSEQQLLAGLVNRGVADVRQLSASQAAEMKEKLVAKIRDRSRATEAALAAPIAQAALAEPTTAPAEPARADPVDLVDDATAATIVRLAKEAGYSDRQFRDALAKKGHAGVASVPAAEAAAMIGRLESRIAGMDEARRQALHNAADEADFAERLDRSHEEMAAAGRPTVDPAAREAVTV